MPIEAVDDLQRALNAMKSDSAEENFASERIEQKAPFEKPEVEERPETKLRKTTILRMETGLDFG